MDGVLRDVNSSRSHISRTIYLIDMKFIEVMLQVVESFDINFQANLKSDKICCYSDYLMV